MRPKTALVPTPLSSHPPALPVMSKPWTTFDLVELSLLSVYPLAPRYPPKSSGMSSTRGSWLDLMSVTGRMPMKVSLLRNIHGEDIS